MARARAVAARAAAALGAAAATAAAVARAATGRAAARERYEPSCHGGWLGGEGVFMPVSHSRRGA